MPYYQSNTLKHALCSSSSPLRRSGGEVLERICSKLDGGLDKAIVPVGSPVLAIEGPYATRAGELQDMVLRNIDCANLSAEYSLIDSHFSIIDDLKTVNNQENDLYFYHSDHLGSSSFITDADGIVSQHLQYLPYGELFAEQRDNTARYYTPYKFSGKEKDEETGYSYFGARYYMSDVSVWLSVDPMADEHPEISAYAYCMNNPLKFIDKFGLTPEDPPGTNPDLANKQIETNNIPKGANPETYSIEPSNEHYGNGKTIPPPSENTTPPAYERFPLNFKPNSFLKYPGRLGDARDGGARKHAGCDLYAPVGTPVYAIKKGVVIQAPYQFYKGSSALEIDHGDFVGRYCEIIPIRGLKAGDPITAGQQLGTVANLRLKQSMLHFEMYSGHLKGSLTILSNMPYQRRKDLINPAPYLIKWNP